MVWHVFETLVKYNTGNCIVYTEIDSSRKVCNNRIMAIYGTCNAFLLTPWALSQITDNTYIGTYVSTELCYLWNKEKIP